MLASVHFNLKRTAANDWLGPNSQRRLTRTVRKGISRLTLLSRESREVLHSGIISGVSVERAVQLTANGSCQRRGNGCHLSGLV